MFKKQNRARVVAFPGKGSGLGFTLCFVGPLGLPPASGLSRAGRLLRRKTIAALKHDPLKNMCVLTLWLVTGGHLYHKLKYNVNNRSLGAESTHFA